MMHNNYKEQANYSDLDHMIEGLSVTKSILLLITLRDESSFITSNCAIRIVFDFEHPMRFEDCVIYRDRI